MYFLHYPYFFTSHSVIAYLLFHLIVCLYIVYQNHKHILRRSYMIVVELATKQIGANSLNNHGTDCVCPIVVFSDLCNYFSPVTLNLGAWVKKSLKISRNYYVEIKNYLLYTAHLTAIEDRKQMCCQQNIRYLNINLTLLPFWNIY